MVALLAVAGGLALAVRLTRTGLRLALRAAEIARASGLAEASARRGDLTGMAEGKAAARRARRQRVRDRGMALLWLGWVVIPLVLGWMPAGYALAAPLWLLPSPRVRIRPPPS